MRKNREKNECTYKITYIAVAINLTLLNLFSN